LAQKPPSWLVQAARVLRFELLHVPKSNGTLNNNMSEPACVLSLV
jgi:hypothetical protein